MGTLSYRHQHDVHHAYAPHQKADGADDNRHQRYRTHDLAEGVGNGGGAGNGKAVRLVVLYVTPAAQQAPNLILSLRYLPRIGFSANEVLVVGRVMLMVGVPGNANKLVGRVVAEEG